MTDTIEAIHQARLRELDAEAAAMEMLEALAQGHEPDAAPDTAAASSLPPQGSADDVSIVQREVQAQVINVEPAKEIPVFAPGSLTPFEDEIADLEAALLADLNACAEEGAAASINVVIARTRPSTVGSIWRSKQNRLAYEKKRPTAKRYAKPSEMTDEDRAAHLRAQRDRENIARNARRAAARAAAKTESDE
ncbi:hypothetical protein [Pararhodobacter aggregans]